MSEPSVLQQAFGIEDKELLKLFHQVSLYLSFDDPDALLAAMATAISVEDTDGEPLWLMLVGPSSGSKTETIRMVAKVADRQVSDLTLAGLLTQRPGKNGPGPRHGLLAQLGDDCNAFVTISDMSSLLGRGNISGQTQTGVFEALRDIYDGAYQRQMDRVSPAWTGRITMLAAVTPAIDQMRTHAEALGPRWVYFRLQQLDDSQRALVGHTVANRTNLNEQRADVAEQVDAIIKRARHRLLGGGADLSDHIEQVVLKGANLATYGRATVPRDYRGQIEGEAHWEEPGRLTQQLLKLARGLAALGIGDEAVERVVRRAALSCMPSTRLAVLEVLAGQDAEEWLSTNQIATITKLHRLVARDALEDWASVAGQALVERRIKPPRNGDLMPEPDEDDESSRQDTRARQWRVAPNARELVSLAAQSRQSLDGQ